MPYYVKGKPGVLSLESKPATTHLFLAEGEAEVGLIEAYLTSIAAPEPATTILCFAGVNRIAPQSAELAKFISKSPDKIVGIGLLADADDNPQGRVDVTINVAKSFGFKKGGALNTNSVSVEDGRTFAFFISPGPNQNGRIEDTILGEIGASQLFGCVGAAFPCIEEQTGAPVNSKASVQMFISARMNNSMAGILHAFRAAVFDVQHEAYAGPRTMIDRVMAAG